MTCSFPRTLKLKVRGESYRWLDAAAIEVNQVFNYCNEIALATATRTDLHVRIRGEQGADGVEVGGFVTPVATGFMRLNG